MRAAHLQAANPVRILRQIFVAYVLAKRLGAFCAKRLGRPKKDARDKAKFLRNEAASLEMAKATYLLSRPAYFHARQNLEVKRMEFDHLTINFQSMHGAQVADMLLAGSNRKDIAPEKLAEIERRVGASLKTISLDLAEAFWDRHEIPEARTYLGNKTREYNAASRELAEASRQLSSLAKTLETANSAVRARNAELGADTLPAYLHTQNAQTDAQLRIVRRLLKDAHDIEKIAEMTGFDRSVIDRAASISGAGVCKS